MKRNPVLPTASQGPKGMRETSMLVFSIHGAGKTYLASTIPRCLSIDLEGGTNLLHATATQPRTWEELMGVLAALAIEDHKFDSVVLDTADRAWSLCEESVCRDLGIPYMGAAGRGKDWALAKTKWKQLVWGLIGLRAAPPKDSPPGTIGRKVMPWFLAHEKTVPLMESRNGTAVDTGRSLITVSLPNTAKLILCSAVDFSLHLHVDKEEAKKPEWADSQEATGGRFLLTRPTETASFKIEAKGRGMPGKCLPAKIPAHFPTLVRVFQSTFTEENST